MRLINADRLKEVIDKNFGHTGAAEVMQQIIDKQPTAYDLEKVIDQLTTEQAAYALVGNRKGVFAVIECIDIVRGE